MPADLEGRRCLDIGTYDGFWAFEMERRGGEVTAIDILDDTRWDWPANASDAHREAIEQRKGRGDGFLIARRVLGSSVERSTARSTTSIRQRTANSTSSTSGRCCPHLRDPVLALERVRAITRGQLLIVDAIALGSTLLGPRSPWLAFYGTAGGSGAAESTRAHAHGASGGMEVRSFAAPDPHARRGRLFTSRRSLAACSVPTAARPCSPARVGDPHAALFVEPMVRDVPGSRPPTASRSPRAPGSAGALAHAVPRRTGRLLPDRRRPAHARRHGPELRASARRARARAGRAGRADRGLRLIVITHRRLDHVGLLEILVRRSGAEVAALDLLGPLLCVSRRKRGRRRPRRRVAHAQPRVPGTSASSPAHLRARTGRGLEPQGHEAAARGDGARLPAGPCRCSTAPATAPRTQFSSTRAARILLGRRPPDRPHLLGPFVTRPAGRAPRRGAPAGPDRLHGIDARDERARCPARPPRPGRSHSRHAP